MFKKILLMLLMVAPLSLLAQKVAHTTTLKKS